MSSSATLEEDCYRILGVSCDVGEEGLKRAYKRQALRWHPDKNHGPNSAQAEERFKKVSEAYQILCDRRSKSSAVGVARRRHSDANKEVLFSKTYGWSGVNISFYWTGPPPTPEPSETPRTSSQRRRKTAPAKVPPSPTSPQASEESRNEQPAAGAQQREAEQRPRRSPLELFKEMFESTSPLASFDGLRRQGSFLESMFGSLRRDDVKVDTQPQQQGSQPGEGHRCQESCTKSMHEGGERMAFIQQEYKAGDLNEEEYKELMSVFATP
jgi:curved DNA-binding protein CbpA